MALYTFIAEEQASSETDWTVVEMCAALEVSRSGYYDWLNRDPSDREMTDRLLEAEIEAIWECSARTYGAPRVHAWLHKHGYNPSIKRVARLMRRNGWTGDCGRVRVKTTKVDRKATFAGDLVGRAFNPTAPDELWVGDITYLRTGEGWLFLATVIDLYSRRIIGWAAADHMRTSLVESALKMAVATRGGSVNGVIFHSDKGTQYTSGDYKNLCKRLGVTQSMGATGVCWDNACAESAFATIKRELAHRTQWATRAQARRDLIRYIEGWFNPHRLHSTIGYNSPIEHELAFYRHGDGLAA